jgi:basic membrane protein A
MMCSSGYYAVIEQVAPLFPHILFVSTTESSEMYGVTGSLRPAMAANHVTLFANQPPARYLAGIVAGGMAKVLGVKRIGYVAAFNAAAVNYGLNAFVLGMRTQVPDLRLSVSYIDSFYYPYAERWCARSFLLDGIRIIAQHTVTRVSTRTHGSAIAQRRTHRSCDACVWALLWNRILLSL